MHCELVAKVRSQPLADRPCSGSSLDSHKMSLIDDNSAPHHADDDGKECQLQQLQQQRDDAFIIQPKASSSPAQLEYDDDVTADDDRPRDLALAGAFPVKPVDRSSMPASCPTSPDSDDVRTSAEGRPCDDADDEVGEQSDDDIVTSSS